jgi:hypothetical protein
MNGNGRHNDVGTARAIDPLEGKLTHKLLAVGGEQKCDWDA